MLNYKNWICIVLLCISFYHVAAEEENNKKRILNKEVIDLLDKHTQELTTIIENCKHYFSHKNHCPTKYGVWEFDVKQQ